MKFLADNMLGRLGKWLRLFGYDTLYHAENSDEENIRMAMAERRILLTRDRRVKPRPGLQLVQIQSENVMEQLNQLVDDVHLTLDLSKMMVRCSLCNAVLKKIEKEKIKDQVPPRAFQAYADFFSCPACHHLYWQGAHLERMKRQLQEAGLLP